MSLRRIILAESKQVGVLYHFTNEVIIKEIVKSNVLQTSNGYVSLTRNYNLDFGNIRITLNGDKLSNRYKIEPFYDGVYNATTKRKVRSPMRDQEREERIEKSITNLDRYIIQIDTMDLSTADFLKFHSNIPCNFVNEWRPVK